MQITNHFRREQFDMPARRGEAYAEVPPELLPNLTRLCELLESLLAWCKGQGINITAADLVFISRYRTPRYNALVGGEKNSRHMHADALDFRVKGLSAFELHALVLRAHKAGALPKLGGLGLYDEWIHIDARPTRRLVQWDRRKKAKAVAA